MTAVTATNGVFSIFKLYLKGFAQITLRIKRNKPHLDIFGSYLHVAAKRSELPFYLFRFICHKTDASVLQPPPPFENYAPQSRLKIKSEKQKNNIKKKSTRVFLSLSLSFCFFFIRITVAHTYSSYL